MEIKEVSSTTEILKCWEVLFLLRPHLIENNFVATVQEMMSEGYQLAFVEEGDKAVACVGFRYLQYLYNGKHIYVDDLVTLAAYRGKGYAAKLLDYVDIKAKEKGYNAVTLDSGYLRTDAHRLYLNKGFTLVAHHFSKNIK